MFYVKKEVDEDLEIKLEITRDNVYGRCPFCGCEVLVDLEEVLGNDGSLSSSAVACSECSKKRGTKW